jgi:hypothetical protein
MDRLIFCKKISELKRSIIISIISIVFLLHPTITKYSFAMFQCIEIDKKVSVVKIDTEISCFSDEHLKWCILLGVPIIIVWVIGMPMVGLRILIRYRKSLEKT